MQAASLLDGFSFDLFPPFENGLTAPEVDVSRRQVVQALVVSTVVVVADELLDALFELSWQVVQQDPVFHRAMISLDLALHHRVVRPLTGIVALFLTTGAAHAACQAFSKETGFGCIDEKTPKAIERVRRTQSAAYLKILALLVPREHKVEHRNLIKELSDEQLEAMIEYYEASLAVQHRGSVRVIEGTIEPAAATAHAPKPKNRLMLEADTAVGPRERMPRKVPSPAGT